MWPLYTVCSTLSEQSHTSEHITDNVMVQRCLPNDTSTGWKARFQTIKHPLLCNRCSNWTTFPFTRRGKTKKNTYLQNKNKNLKNWDLCTNINLKYIYFLSVLCLILYCVLIVTKRLQFVKKIFMLFCRKTQLKQILQILPISFNRLVDINF